MLHQLSLKQSRTYLYSALFIVANLLLPQVVHLIPNGGDEDFFLGTLSYGHEEVPAINPGSFELLIRKDLGSA